MESRRPLKLDVTEGAGIEAEPEFAGQWSDVGCGDGKITADLATTSLRGQSDCRQFS